MNTLEGPASPVHNRPSVLSYTYTYIYIYFLERQYGTCFDLKLINFGCNLTAGD